MSISHDEASKWSKKETFTGIIIGFLLGISAGWFFYDSSHTDTKEANEKLMNELKEERNRLNAEKSDAEKDFAICKTEKTNLENSIKQNYVTREELNRCIQNNSKFADANQKITNENIKLSSQVQNKDSCLQRQQNLQKQLDDIRKELQSRASGGWHYYQLTEEDIQLRREQQQQLVDQLNKLNCQ